ncbi:MAG: Energy-coupling factor transporter ATP-binding protein EcfA2 [Tenericutes bacterium ADurb.Bin239]|nr:MAG: Energy-coupling factor transporter ATP-binding protein EcfA2 [Tenericutes bacterium ADurb.Bin239]
MAVKFSHVDFTYAPKSPFQFDALHDINLVIKDESFTAVIGHTGSGKSTLIQHINALLIPTSGVVQIEDSLILPTKKKKYLRRIKRKLKNKKVKAEQKERLAFLQSIVLAHKTYKVKELRKKVGVVFQFPEYQLFEETVIKDVAFGPRNFGVSAADASLLAKEALTMVGINESFYARSPFELSGGEKRRVAIAGILALKPEILVLDEPTAGLDPLSAAQMMETFAKIHKNGTTIVLVTHDMDLVLRYASDVVVMKDGKILEETTPVKLFADVKEEYSLEVPTFYAVMQELVKRGCPLDISKINNVSDLAKMLKSLKEKV